jgi:hypothetical protein
VHLLVWVFLGFVATAFIGKRPTVSEKKAERSRDHFRWRRYKCRHLERSLRSEKSLFIFDRQNLKGASPWDF